nr:S1-like domain-containing RNA-binding protein [Marinifilum sp. N1E240]
MTPKAIAGEFAVMKVKSVTNVGAFLDWGLAKDLLVPFSEQRDKLQEGLSYLVFVYIDESTGRIVATAKIEKILKDVELSYNEGDEVDILVGKKGDLGFQVLINDDALGIIYKNEIFGHLKTGDKRKAYIKKLRPDGKIDISLQQQGYQNEVPKSGQQILDMLKDEEGFLPLNDKSSPDDIYYTLKMSKKNFKKAIGLLYKQKLITIEDAGIYLVQ